MQKTILDIISKENTNLTVGDGYISMAVSYITFAVFLWVAPAYISMTSARTSIITGSVFYVFYQFTFLWPQKYLLYTSSAFCGLGAALLWTGQGKYLIDNSNSSTMSRNTSIFLHSTCFHYLEEISSYIVFLPIRVLKRVSAFMIGSIAPKVKIRPGMKIACSGFLLHVVAFIMILLNLPNNAPFEVCIFFN